MQHGCCSSSRCCCTRYKSCRLSRPSLPRRCLAVWPRRCSTHQSRLLTPTASSGCSSTCCCSSRRCTAMRSATRGSTSRRTRAARPTSSRACIASRRFTRTSLAGSLRAAHSWRRTRRCSRSCVPSSTSSLTRGSRSRLCSSSSRSKGRLCLCKTVLRRTRSSPCEIGSCRICRRSLNSSRRYGRCGRRSSAPSMGRRASVSQSSTLPAWWARASCSNCRRRRLRCGRRALRSSLRNSR
mmetsp:Transcript_71435/g.158854  ORF Transcript_71435/g.158854 Transcript_71435/m.158854 type:complete len:239 (-) Transcript_71435:77-793(-)